MILTTENTNKKIITSTSIVNLLGDKQQHTIENYYRKLEYDLGCTYIFYIYEDIINDQKIIYTSNWGWQNYLIGEKLINSCPIFKAADTALNSGKRSIILPWNNIHSKTSTEKDITLLRSEFNIANGVGITRTNGLVREGIGLGADIKDYEFYRRILEDNTIYKILKTMRYLTLKNNIVPVIH